VNWTGHNSQWTLQQLLETRWHLLLKSASQQCVELRSFAGSGWWIFSLEICLSHRGSTMEWAQPPRSVSNYRFLLPWMTAHCRRLWANVQGVGHKTIDILLNVYGRMQTCATELDVYYLKHLVKYTHIFLFILNSHSLRFIIWILSGRLISKYNRKWRKKPDRVSKTSWTCGVLSAIVLSIFVSNVFRDETPRYVAMVTWWTFNHMWEV